MNIYRIFGHVLLVSGSANNSSNAGAFYWNSNNESGNSNVNIGGSLSYFNALLPKIPASRQNTKQFNTSLVRILNGSGSNSR